MPSVIEGYENSSIFLQYGGCVNDKSQQMGVRKPGLPKGTLREKDVGQGYSSPCP